MKLPHWAGLLVILAATSVGYASIVGWNCAADGDGAIVMGPPSWDEIGGEYHLTMDGSQYWYPAHVLGDFTTDTPEDPTVWIVENVDNFTNFTWTDYHIELGMTKSFSIIGVVAPPDWTWSITPPVGGQPFPGGNLPGTGWVGTVNYYAGTPIPPGQSGSFGLIVSFAGSVQFCTQQIPTPEPASLGLFALGLLAYRRR